MATPSLTFKLRNALRIAIQFHGVWFPFVMLHRLALYTYYKFIASATFQLNGREHRYCIHPYSLNNERAVEVSVAGDFLNGRSGEVLELGNVLSNYLDFPHDIVDKYERSPGVINEDIVTYSPKKQYDSIVSISTLEHVGWDEPVRDPQKILLAIDRLKSLLKNDGVLLVTLPMGYNPHVDAMITDQRTGLSKIHYLLRVSRDNRWSEVRHEDVIHAKYGSPFPSANAVIIGYFRNNSGHNAERPK